MTNSDVKQHEKAYQMLIEKFEYALSKEEIEKPLSWAIYHVWKEISHKEKRRKKSDRRDG